MEKMVDHKKYSYSVIWSDEDQEFVGLCAEFPSLSWLAPNREDALNGIKNIVADVLRDMMKNGESLPVGKGAKVEMRKEDGATVLERFRKAIKREKQNSFSATETETAFSREA